MNADEFMLELYEDGSISEVHVDVNGDPAFIFNWPVFKEKHPELAQLMWEDHTAEIDAALNEGLELGYLENVIVTNDDGTIELGYQVTDAGREYHESIRGKIT